MKVLAKIALLAMIVVINAGTAWKLAKTCSEKSAINQLVDVRLIAAVSNGNTGV